MLQWIAIIGVITTSLKLIRAIDWPWGIVTLPFWGPISLALITILLCRF